MTGKGKGFLWKWWQNALNSRFYFRVYRLWRIYFYFNRREIKGVLVLTLVVLVAIFLDFRALRSQFGAPSQPYDTIFYSKIDSFVQQLAPKPKKSFRNRLEEYLRKRYDTLKLFAFDPNTATADQLRRLGLTAKQIRNVIKYRESGGRFRYKQDFAKLYTMRDFQYKILEPYIMLPHAPKRQPVSDDDTSISHSGQPVERQVQLFYFDPNTISPDSLVLLGFTERQARSIVKARKKGWRFRTKSDFARLYVVSDSMFQRLKPYILLPDSLVKKPDVKTPKIEVNTATAEDFVRLGYTRQEAEYLLEFRRLLGGYYTTFQFYEIRSIRKKIIKQTYRKLWVDTSKISRINLLTASYEQLVAHPYISKDFALWIIKKRKRKGFSIEYLKTSPYFPRYKWSRLKHYVFIPNQ